jgi:hypothetical protein
VRATNSSFGFLETTMAITYQQARANMEIELASVNRIAAACEALGANFYVYFATTGQSGAYFNPATFLEYSTHELMNDMIGRITGATDVSWLDLSTLEKRLTKKWLTDHHMNAYGAAHAYLDVHQMFSRAIPNFREPFRLTEIRYFDGVLFRGTGAQRSNTNDYHDNFAVPVFELPAFHPSERLTNILHEFTGGRRVTTNRTIYANHYGDLYSRSQNVISVPSNNTGRNLLIIGDSMVYWNVEVIAAHFDRTHIYYVGDNRSLNLAQVVSQHNITDVLLFQYGPRMLARATSAATFLEQVVTR